MPICIPSWFSETHRRPSRADGLVAIARELLSLGGANPADSVSTHITAGSNNIEALELLHRFGLDKRRRIRNARRSS